MAINLTDKVFTDEAAARPLCDARCYASIPSCSMDALAVW
jgi:hypothetical protein